MGQLSNYTFKVVGNLDKNKTEDEILKQIKQISDSVGAKDAGKIDIKISTKNTKEAVSEFDEIGKKIGTSYKDVQNEITRVSQTYTDNAGRLIKTTSTLVNGVEDPTKRVTQYLKDSTIHAKSLAQEMGAVIRRTLESAATLGLMYGALNQLRQGIDYIKELDKELTNIQVVTGMSEKSVQALGMQYNSLAKEMGVTTLEVTRGSVEWLFNQGHVKLL